MYELLQHEARNEELLLTVAKLVDEGSLTVEQVIDFLNANVQLTERAPDDPLVITLGLGPEVFDDAIFYAPTCDALEARLFETLRSGVPGFVAQTEASERNGETLSVRFAVWHASLDAVLIAADSIWQLLEVAPFSAIYPSDDPRKFYAAAVARRRPV